MLRVLTALSAVAIAGWSLAGSVSDANAGGYRHGCCQGRTFYKDVTRYHNTYHTHYVPHVVRHVHVRWFQSVTRVHVVNVIHERNVPVWKTINICQTRWLPPRVQYSWTTVHASSY